MVSDGVTVDIQTDVQNLLDATTPIDFDAWGRFLAYLEREEPDMLRQWHRASHPPATVEHDIRVFLILWIYPPPGHGLFGSYPDVQA